MSRKPSYSEVLKSPPPRPAPINTELARANNIASEATAGTFSSTYDSNGSAFTNATSLFTPSIWSSTPEFTQSATLPKTFGWETNVSQSQAATAATQATKQPLTPTVAAPKSAVGLGLQFGTPSRKTNAKIATPLAPPTRAPAAVKQGSLPNSSPYKYQQGDITDAQMSVFKRDYAANNAANTYPLAQQPFTNSRDAMNQPREAASPVECDSTVSFKSNPFEEGVREYPSIEASSHSRAAKVTEVNDTSIKPIDAIQSIASEIGDHPEAAESRNGMKAPPVAQQPHPLSFKHAKGDSLVEFSWAWDGALDALNGLNPSHFIMPYGSRAVCIKTEFVDNLYWSIQKGLWCCIDKVGQRINRLFDSLKDPGEKVFFLFSINGQKSYSGLAEMGAPWAVRNENTEGFKMSDSSRSQQHGTIPVAWIFVKNVSYTHFDGINHSHNGQPIINMWNGMHFPGDNTRVVLETYAMEPYFTNILGWHNEGPYDPRRPITHASQIDPRVTDNRVVKYKGRKTVPPPQRANQNGHTQYNQPMRGQHTNRARGQSSSQAMRSDNWRHPGHQPAQPSQHAMVPAYQSNALTHRGMLPAAQPVTPPPNFNGYNSPTPRPGDLFIGFMDGNGNCVPLTPGGTTSNQFLGPTQGGSPVVNRSIMHGPGQQLRAQSPSYNNLRARGGGYSHRGAFNPGNAAYRGNRGGTHNAMRGGHAASQLRMQHPVEPSPSPALQLMRSQVGLEDPFGPDRGLSPTKSMQQPKPANRNNQLISKKSTDALKRVVSTANFVPKSLAAQEDTAPGYKGSKHGALVRFTEIDESVTPSVSGLGNNDGGVALRPNNAVGPTPQTKPKSKTYDANGDYKGLSSDDLPEFLPFLPHEDPGSTAKKKRRRIEYLKALSLKREVDLELAKEMLEVEGVDVAEKKV